MSEPYVKAIEELIHLYIRLFKDGELESERLYELFEPIFKIPRDQLKFQDKECYFILGCVNYNEEQDCVAMEYWEMAGDHTLSIIYRMLYLFEHNNHLTADEVNLLKRAYEQGHPIAAYLLGLIYHHRSNDERVIECFEELLTYENKKYEFGLDIDYDDGKPELSYAIKFEQNYNYMMGDAAFYLAKHHSDTTDRSRYLTLATDAFYNSEAMVYKAKMCLQKYHESRIGEEYLQKAINLGNDDAHLILGMHYIRKIAYLDDDDDDREVVKRAKTMYFNIEPSDETMCAICRDELDKTDVNKIKVLFCGHYFHKDCISRAPKHECPLCKQ
jgi:tetratricopeptide (TPR) repeat protein